MGYLELFCLSFIKQDNKSKDVVFKKLYLFSQSAEHGKLIKAKKNEI